MRDKYFIFLYFLLTELPYNLVRSFHHCLEVTNICRCRWVNGDTGSEFHTSNQILFLHESKETTLGILRFYNYIYFMKKFYNYINFIILLFWNINKICINLNYIYFYNYILWQLNINIGRKNDGIQLGLKLNINK